MDCLYNRVYLEYSREYSTHTHTHVPFFLFFFPPPDTKDILVMLSDMDINAIAGTLKLYFRELPEPLLTDRFYPAFMEGIGMTFNLSPRSHFPYRISLKDCH